MSADSSNTNSPPQENAPTPAPRKTGWLRLTLFAALVAGVSFAASVLGLFSVVGFDQRLEIEALDFISRYDEPVPFRGVRVVWIDEERHGGAQEGSASPALRRCHAKMVEALARAGADVVAFDFHFAREGSPEDAGDMKCGPSAPGDCQHPNPDDCLSEAIRTAEDPAGEAKAARVVVGSVRGPMLRPSGSPRLNQVLGRGHWGLIDIAQSPAGGIATLWVKLAVDESVPGLRRAELTPSFPLQVYMQKLWPARPWKARRARGGIRIEFEDKDQAFVIPTDHQLRSLVRLPNLRDLQAANYSYDQLLSEIEGGSRLDEFRNQIVMIGLRSPQDRYPLSSSHAVPGMRSAIYGVEVHASKVWNLLEDMHLTPLGLAAQMLVLLGMAGAGAWLRTRSGGWTGKRISLKKLLGNIPFLPPILSEAQVPVLLLGVLGLYFLALIAAARIFQTFSDFPYDILSILLAYAFAPKAMGHKSRPGEGEQDSPRGEGRDAASPQPAQGEA